MQYIKIFLAVIFLVIVAGLVGVGITSGVFYAYDVMGKWGSAIFLTLLMSVVGTVIVVVASNYGKRYDNN